MKKASVIVLVVVGLMFAAYAEAAKPKRRTRNANRVGPYAGALLGMSTYTGDQDVGYAAQFGYRFNRYIAAEFALRQFGDLHSSARAEINRNGLGFVPA